MHVFFIVFFLFFNISYASWLQIAIQINYIDTISFSTIDVSTTTLWFNILHVSFWSGFVLAWRVHSLLEFDFDVLSYWSSSFELIGSPIGRVSFTKTLPISEFGFRFSLFLTFNFDMGRIFWKNWILFLGFCYIVSTVVQIQGVLSSSFGFH